MLGKLLKHEFRATARIMLPLYIVSLALSFVANLSLRIVDSPNSAMLNILASLLIGLFGIAIVGIWIMSIIIMVNRFRSNLMGSEGYVMFTLPASMHEIVWSKIIVSVVWFIATFAVSALAGIIAFFRIEYMTSVFEWLGELFRELTAYYAINGAIFLIEGLILALLSCASVCLLFYASISFGHSFSNHKKILSVAFFFVSQFIMQILGTFIAVNIPLDDFWWRNTPAETVHLFMLSGIASAFVYGAVFYIVTTLLLKKRLNLE